MKALRFSLIFAFVFSWLGGCTAVQQPVPMDDALWSEKQEVIGIALVDVPKPAVVLAGQQGLLDYAVNSGLAAALRSKVETWEVSSFSEVPKQVAEEISARGYKTKLLEAPIALAELQETKSKLGYAKRDFTPLKQEHQIDKLVVIALVNAGTFRTYYGMIPTSKPVAQINTLTQVIDLDDNRLLYYQPNTQNRSAEGDWDEKPEYPNLTNAFYQALDATEQDVIAPFRAPLLSAQ